MHLESQTSEFPLLRSYLQGRCEWVEGWGAAAGNRLRNATMSSPGLAGGKRTGKTNLLTIDLGLLRSIPYRKAIVDLAEKKKSVQDPNNGDFQPRFVATGAICVLETT